MGADRWKLWVSAEGSWSPGAGTRRREEKRPEGCWRGTRLAQVTEAVLDRTGKLGVLPGVEARSGLPSCASASQPGCCASWSLGVFLHPFVLLFNKAVLRNSHTYFLSMVQDMGI